MGGVVLRKLAARSRALSLVSRIHGARIEARTRVFATQRGEDTKRNLKHVKARRDHFGSGVVRRGAALLVVSGDSDWLVAGGMFQVGQGGIIAE